MQKHTKIRILTYTTIFLFIIIFFLIKPSASQTSFNWKWSPNVQFRLPAYNTVIAFNDWVYLDSFQWDGMSATLVKFFNFEIAGDDSPLSSLGLSVQNANCTINYVNKQGKAEIVLSAPSGTVSNLTVYYPNNYPVAIAVDAETIENSKYFRSLNDWQLARCPAVYLDKANAKVQVKAQHSSPVTITIYWQGVSPTPTPGPGPLPPTPTPSPQPLPPLVVPPEAVPLVNVGLIVIVVVVVGAYAYSQITQPKKVSQKWRQRQKQTKPVKWEKKKRFVR